MASKGPHPDDSMQEYLRQLDLGQLDLDHIDLEEGAPSALANWLQLGVLAVMVGLLIWLPNTSYYQLHSQASWLLWPLGLVTAGLTLSLYRWLWSGVQRVANAAMQGTYPTFTLPNVPTFNLPRIPQRVWRGLMLLTVLTLGGIMLFAMPREAEWQGSGYSSNWFLGVGMALLTGITLGRWLIAQADAAPLKTAPIEPFVMPSWVKWVTLAVLVGGGIFASFGHYFMSSESETAGFAMAGVGFAVGIFGAIWLARRFDEVEAEVRSRRRDDP